MSGMMTRDYRLAFSDIISEWNAIVNGSIVTTALLIMSGLLGAFSALGRVASWISITSFGITCFFVVVSFVIATLRLLVSERSARKKLEDGVKPRLVIRIERLVADAPYGTLARRPCVIACVTVRNEGFESVARKWQMLIGDRGVTKIDLRQEISAVTVSDVTDWSETPPIGTKSVYKGNADVDAFVEYVIRRGESPQWIFAAQIPYEDVTADDLRRITIRCEDFLGETYDSVLPEGNIHLGFARVYHKFHAAFAI